MRVLAKQAKSLVLCNSCTVYLRDAASQELITFTGRRFVETTGNLKEAILEEIRIPVSRETVAGYVASTGETLRLQVCSFHFLPLNFLFFYT